MCYLHCGDVLSGEGIRSVADEQACFTHSPGIRNGGEERFDREKKALKTEACCLICAQSVVKYSIFFREMKATISTFYSIHMIMIICFAFVQFFLGKCNKQEY